jgi:hypothetical protein
MRGAALVVVVVVAWLAGPAGADTGPPPQLDLTPLAAKANADLLWPLAEPPDATPHLALMSWYGEAWPELCSAKPIAGTPAQVIDYAAAWCRSADSIADALYALLDRSSAAYRANIRADLIDVLGATDLPGTAVYWLDSHRLGYLKDAVVATQLELGKIPPWPLVDLTDPRVRDRDCHLLAHASRAGDARAMGMLEMLANESAGSTCRRLSDDLQCPLATGIRTTTWVRDAELAAAATAELDACGSLVQFDSRTTTLAGLFASALAARWPLDGPITAARWSAIARVAARYVFWGPKLEDLALSALENTLATATCAPAVVDEVRAILRELQGKPDRVRDGPRDARIAAVARRACS